MATSGEMNQPPRRPQDIQLTPQERSMFLMAIAGIYHSMDSARVLLDSIGFPTSHAPMFAAPIDFWSEVFSQIDTGVPTTFRLMLETALQTHGDHPDLLELAERHGVLDVPPDTPSPTWRGVPLSQPLLSVHSTSLGDWGALTYANGQPVLAGLGELSLWFPSRAPIEVSMPFGGFERFGQWGAWGSVRGRPVLASGGENGTISLWLLSNPSPPGGRLQAVVTHSLTGHDGPVLWGAWTHHEGRPLLASGGADGTVRWWDPVKGRPLGNPVNGHSQPVSWGTWGMANGHPVLATGGQDEAVILWEPGQSGRIEKHTGPTRWGAWGTINDQPVLATGGDGSKVQMSNVDTTSSTVTLISETTGAGHLLWGAWTTVGGQAVLAAGGDSRFVHLLTPGPGASTARGLIGHTGTVRWGSWGSIAGHPVLATGGDDTTVRLWDPVRGVALGEPLTGHPTRVHWGIWGQVGNRPTLFTGSHEEVRPWEIIEDRPLSRFLPAYRSDAAPAADELDRTDDAAAVAELVTARTARPPLAVGLFGDWGEGKSHFLNLLRQEVKTAARPDNPLSHTAVRQVQFNAWHYAETDLWASLVAELFAQLATPTDGDVASEQRRQSRLTAELIAERGLRERLRSARGRRDDLRRALREPAGPWESLPQAQQQELRLLAGERPEEVFREAARSAAAFQETGRAAWRLVRGVPAAVIVKFLSLVAALAAVAAAVVWALPGVWRWAASVPGVAGLIAAQALMARFAVAAKARASKAWQAALRYGTQQRQRMETAAEVAEAEVKAFETQLQNLTAAGQLAGLAIERAAEGSYRGRLGVMTQIREDFQRMAELLASATQERAVSAHAQGPGRDLVDGEEVPGSGASDSRPDHSGGARADEVDDELPSIDRIILYIDDLDRCPPQRVVEMLEAIHLLLAVELFVVVVAVDPRWLLRSIASHYRELVDVPSPLAQDDAEEETSVDPDDEELWRSTPTQYLEKIFQVVLTLPPLDTNGYQRLLRTLVGTATAKSPEAPAAPTPSQADTAEPSADPEAAAPGTDGEERTEPTGARAELPAARVVERFDPLTLTPDEITLMDLLGPPLLVFTPRAVKRFANSYGLLTAMRHAHRKADLAEQHVSPSYSKLNGRQPVVYWPYRSSMVLLAALISYPSLGPALFLHLHHAATRDPDQTWARFRTTLTPRREAGVWCNGADPRMTPVQAQQWQALLRGMDHAAAAAANAGLPLPEPLSAWAQWVVPVGRLSFPTGRIVSTLERQYPLP
ncbi:P-loop NTPase fold protein [Streptomyces canus]|uniref:P-loop NTPase fold protein n=1 Tax=Streptomyces canus TaxID=58343 RepID=UPI00324440C6